MTPQALEGLTVVEFGDFISASYCAKLMGDLGAEVIKIERPGSGEESRRFGPFPGDLPDPEKSGLFLYLNGNKHGITLDPGTAAGGRLFRALIRDADVLVENQPPGVLEEMGLGYEDLGKINPSLVMTSISTFGRWGPYSKYKGYDLTAWHGSGVGPVHLGHADREPLRGAWYQGDHWGAIGGATATMLALYARDLTGEGQHVDLSQTDMLASMILGYQMVTVFHMTGEHRKRAGAFGGRSAPTGMFRCKDGYVFLYAFEEHQWQGLVKAMGSPDWAQDPIFQLPSWERAAYGQEILALMEPWLFSHTKEEIFEACQANRVPSGPVYDAKDLLEHPHLAARGFFSVADHPAVGRTTIPGRPFVLSETPWRLRRTAPLLGEHNDLIYRGRLGLSTAQLSDLRRSGVV